MRDVWFSDNRDLVKWGVLIRLADMYEARRILQVAYYRPSDFPQIEIDGNDFEIPKEVLAHFRNLRTVGGIGSNVRITVFDPVFEDRAIHDQAVLALLPAFAQERCIVFLDPDTGLEPQNPSLDHVLNGEASAIYTNMKVGDVFAFYQHQTNRGGHPWIEPKRLQLTAALQLPQNAIKVARGHGIASDVVFFFVQKE